MEIIIGKNSGFCNGVKYTIDKAIEELSKFHPIYCLGEIVHNKDVVASLEEKGMITVNDILEIPDNSKVIIRAHGESLDIYEKAKEKNLVIIDLTCGKIKIIHKDVLKHNDSFIIIIGKHDHPEVIGTKGHCKYAYVISNENEIDGCYKEFINSKRKDIYIISQTTFNNKDFDMLLDKIKSTFHNIDIIVNKSICNATNLRQKEVVELSKTVDKMVIIGGKNSSNTKELYNLSKDYCETYLIENKEDIDFRFNESDKVGIMAGASTSNDIVLEVIEEIKKTTLK